MLTVSTNIPHLPQYEIKKCTDLGIWSVLLTDVNTIIPEELILKLSLFR